MERRDEDWASLTPYDIEPRAKMVDGKIPKLKIACVAIGEVGHLIPVSHVADELVKRGHEVHFITNQDDFIREKAKIFLDPIGVNVHFTNDKIDRAILLKGDFRKTHEFPHLKMQTDWAPHVFDVVSKIMPDVVVSDFWCMAGTQAADKLNIPSVINYPGPLHVVEAIGLMSMTSMKSTVNLGGLIFFKRQFTQFLVQALCNIQSNGGQSWLNYCSSFMSRQVLCNTFWGFEEARSLPPNFYLTGSLVKSQDNLYAQLKEKHVKLFDWLEEAHQRGQPVVYISVGSYCVLQEWSINALYYGLKKLGCRVVWSLKAQYKLPVESDPDFWVQSWIPQVELLSHPVVKVGISHCGAGIMEFIAAGVPVIGWPHFFDQFQYANLVCEQNQAGKILLSRMRYSPKTEHHFSYVDPEFTKEDVYKLFKEVMIDKQDFYKGNMLRLQRLQQEQNGRQKAAEVVEKTAVSSYKHLVDLDLQKRRDQEYFCTIPLLFIFMIAFVYYCISFGMANFQGQHYLAVAGESNMLNFFGK